MKTKKYQKPKITAKKIKINFFLRRNPVSGLDAEGLLLAGCTCWDEIRGGGPCGCSGAY